MPRFPLPARLCALALAAALIPAAALLPRPAPAAEPPHAAILMYHRFGEDRIPSTNIRLEQFDAQLAALKQAQIPVRPLPGIAAALKAGTPLPDRTVALTADDAYLSVLTEGWPRIRKAGYSLTLFVATGPVDQKLRGYLTWDQIRQLRDEGVTIGAHSNDHPSLPALTPDAMKADLDTSMRRFREELGEAPTLFAWPFGEWDARSMAVLQGYGFEAAFGQHSGVAYAGHDMLWLPRFPMNEAFGSVERTLMAVNALPLPLSGIEPADVLIKLGQTTNPPVYRFTVGEGLERMKELLCYTGQGERIALKELAPRRYEAVPGKAFAPPRDRISCTLPTAQAGRFRWSGIQFTVQP